MIWNSPTVRILTGLLIGLAVGATLASGHPHPLTRDLTFLDPQWLAQTETFTDALGGVWLDALRMTIIPLVFALLVVGVAQTAGTVKAGGLAAQALIAFAVLLLLSATIAAIATPALLDVWPAPAAAAQALRDAGHKTGFVPPPTPPFGDWLRSFVPANPVKAAADGAMASIVVFALAVGLAASRLAEGQRKILFDFFDALQAAMMVIVGWVLWAAPVGVMLLSFGVGARTGVGAVGVLSHYVAVVSIMCLAGGVIGFLIAWLGGGAPIGKLIAALIPVEAMAISTQSSLASLPVMLEATDRLGVPERARDLVMPMAVAVFRITSPAGNLAVVIYIAHLYGIPLDVGKLAIGVVVACLVSLAAVGVASSVTFFTTLVPISMAMGLPMDLLPLFLAVETLPDFSRTIGNVTADVGVTAMVGRWARGPKSAPDPVQ
jgi:proton glutamate symport protein